MDFLGRYVRERKIRIYEDVIETESGENIYIKVLKRFKEMKENEVQDEV